MKMIHFVSGSCQEYESGAETQPARPLDHYTAVISSHSYCIQSRIIIVNVNDVRIY
jgi:hypothetical protein